MQTDAKHAPWTRKKLTGAGAGALKYDILTALLTTAAQGDPVLGRLALRLSLLITARFNWRTERFAVAQVEMARLWGVTERTAKREIALMRAKGWIAVTRPAARGRVAEHRISFADVMRDTMPLWGAVGPDFTARMSGAPEPDAAPASNVIPLRRDQGAIPPDGSMWSDVACYLQQQDPEVYAAWFAALEPIEDADGGLTLVAAGRFQADYIRGHFMARLTAAVAQTVGAVRELRIVGPGA